MTTPAQDHDIRAALGADRPQRTEAELEAAAMTLLSRSAHRADNTYFAGGDWEVERVSLTTDGESLFWWTTLEDSSDDGVIYRSPLAAAIDLLRHHPELWPEEPTEPEPQPDSLREAAREALWWLEQPEHGSRGEDNDGCCHTCDDPWPCDVEQARRRLAAALEDR